MNDDLRRYLNDHLSGADAALVLIEDLILRQGQKEDRAFYENLRAEVHADLVELMTLMKKAEAPPGHIAQVIGGITSRAGHWKLYWDGMESGDLGLFEALELLLLGIQGKQLLWRVLRELAPFIPAWQEVDFTALENRAIRQHEALEQRRLDAACDIMLSPARERKSA